MTYNGNELSLPFDAGVKEGSISEGSSSGHATIVGSYNERFERPTFPEYSSVSSSCGVPQIYCRSMLSSGNGFGPSNITGDVSRPFQHFSDGACIGDVGYVNEYGAFVYCFNIFHECDDHIQPLDISSAFVPFHIHLSKEDVKLVPDYHPPGTVVTSEGIHVSRVSKSPLRLKFSSSVREGAVLVLPGGASREDLVDPSKFYQYVKEQAARWYEDINNKNSGEKSISVPNGTLHLVTGVDRASSWATATFPYRRTDSHSSLNFEYDESSDPTWKNTVGLTTLYRHHKESSMDGCVGAVFLRFLSVAVGNTGKMSARTVVDVPRHVLPSFELQGARARVDRVMNRFTRKVTKISPCPHEIVFNPSTILLQILLRTDPLAEVAIVPDSVWRSQLSDRHITHPELVRLIHRILKSHCIVTRDGIVTFFNYTSAKAHEIILEPSSSFWEKLPFCLPFFWTSSIGDSSDYLSDKSHKALEEMYDILSH